MSAPGSLWWIWAWPVVLGQLSTLGLLAALLSDGAGEVISWVSLAVPVVAGLWFVWKPRQSRR